MAFKALICPQCGANLELDDGREIGYCEYCGAKVLIREVTEVRHVYDNIGVLENLKILADREYQAGNYRDAYEHYKKALECDANEPVCIFRKAVCSMMLSSEERVLKEACSDIKLAKEIAVMDGQTESREQMEHELLRIYNEYASEYDPDKKYFETKELCLEHLNSCVRILSVAEALNALVANNKDKEELLRSAIELCDKRVYNALRYGDPKEPVSFTPPAEPINRITSIRKMFADEYNHLPERMAQMAYVKAEVERLTKEVGKLKNALKLLQDRGIKPEEGKTYSEYNGVNVFLIALIIATVVFLIWAPTLFQTYQQQAAATHANPAGNFYMIISCIIVLMLPYVIAVISAVSITKNKRRQFYSALDPVPEVTEYDKLYNAKIAYYKKVTELQEASKQYNKLQSEQK